jgi:hypothetical protein
VVAALAVNAATVAVIALPVIPIGSLGASPVPDLNEVARESVGWPQLAAQVSEVYAGLPAEDRARAVLFTGNYGEAGALDRYGPRYGLPAVYSGHNELYFRARPPDTATVVVAVGLPTAFLDTLFESCAVARRIDNGYDVDNEEQGAPVTVCRQPRQPWSQLWPRTLHYSAGSVRVRDRGAAPRDTLAVRS